MTAMLIGVAALVGLVIVCWGAAVMLVQQARGERRGVLGRATSDRASVGADQPAEGRLVDVVQRLGMRVGTKGASLRLKADLAAAGFHGSSAYPVYMGSKFLLLAIGIVVLGL